jgi:hypothetical protein
MDSMPPEMPEAQKRTEATRLLNELVGDPNAGASFIENHRMRWLGSGAKKTGPALLQGKTDVRVELDMLREAASVDKAALDSVAPILAKTDLDAVKEAKALVGDSEVFAALPPEVQAAVVHLAKTDPLTSALRKLMGETEAGTLAMGNTVAKLQGDVRRLEMWDVVSQNQDWSPPPEVLASPDFQQRVAAGEYELVPPNLRHEVGNMAGKYVRRDVWEALRVLPDEQARTHQILQKMLRYMRFNKTVGNPGTWVTNLMGNTSGMYMSGMGPAQSSKAVKESYRAWREYAKDPLAQTLHADIHRRFIAHSLADSDLAKGVVGMTDRSLHNMLDAEMRAKTAEISPLDAMEKVYEASHKALQSTGNAARIAAAGYGTLDVWPKAMAYWGSLERAGFTLDAKAGTSLDAVPFDPAQARKFLLEQGTPAQMIPTEPKALRRAAQDEAARNVMSSFQMFNRLPKGQRLLGAAADIISGGFATSAAELMRIWLTWPKRALATPEARAHHGANMLKWGVVMGWAYGTLKAGQKAAGMDDEELEESKKSLSPTDRSFHNGAMATPIRDANGKPIWIDVSDMVFWPAQLMQGAEGVGLMPGQFSPVQAAKRLVWNSASQLIGGDILQRFAAENDMADAPFQNSRMSAMEAAARAGAVPVGIVNAWKGAQEAGVVPGRPVQAGPPPGPAAGLGKALLGGRVMTSAPDGAPQKSANFELRQAMDEATKLQSGRFKQGIFDILSPKNPDEMRRKAIEKRDKRTQ